MERVNERTISLDEAEVMIRQQLDFLCQSRNRDRVLEIFVAAIDPQAALILPTPKTYDPHPPWGGWRIVYDHDQVD